MSFVLINFKTYPQGSGERAIALAKAADQIAAKLNANVGIAVQALDLHAVARSVSIPVYAQHADAAGPGAHTGRISPELLKAHGAAGTLLNHAECRMQETDLLAAIRKCREAGLKTVVCTDDLDQARRIAAASPDYLAFEDPALISSLKSISVQKPDAVKAFATAVQLVDPRVIPLCGAGVASKKDIEAAEALGTKGVIVAAAVMKAEDPVAAVRSLL